MIVEIVHSFPLMQTSRLGYIYKTLQRRVTNSFYVEFRQIFLSILHQVEFLLDLTIQILEETPKTFPEKQRLSTICHRIVANYCSTQLILHQTALLVAGILAFLHPVSDLSMRCIVHERNMDLQQIQNLFGTNLVQYFTIPGNTCQFYNGGRFVMMYQYVGWLCRTTLNSEFCKCDIPTLMSRCVMPRLCNMATAESSWRIISFITLIPFGSDRSRCQNADGPKKTDP